MAPSYLELYKLQVVLYCMVFHAVFNSISAISRLPVHLSMLSWNSFNKYSAQFFFQATGCFLTYALSKQQTSVREERFLPKCLSSILGKNIGRAGNRTSDLLFLSPQRHRLSYGARRCFFNRCKIHV